AEASRRRRCAAARARRARRHGPRLLQAARRGEPLDPSRDAAAHPPRRAVRCRRCPERCRRGHADRPRRRRVRRVRAPPQARPRSPTRSPAARQRRAGSALPARARPVHLRPVPRRSHDPRPGLAAATRPHRRRIDMKDDDLRDLLVQKLRWLKLPGMAKHALTLLDLAAKDNLSTLDVIHRLCDEEKQSRLRDARFPEINTIDGFNFDFDPGRKKIRARYLALHDLAFLAKGINPLFIGVPGTGKTFLARALAYQACQAARRVVFVSAPRMLNDLHGAE